MKITLIAAVLWLGAPALAHRLDEYLQATLIDVSKDRVEVQMRLAPGVAVLPMVLAVMDTDGDGVISAEEQRAYAERVLRDVSLEVDGGRLPLRLVSAQFPRIAEMREGMGEIHIGFTADVPAGSAHRKLIFENRHESRIAAYMVNCLVSRDPAVRIGTQHRNYEQSFYQLDYTQAGAGPRLGSLTWWLGPPGLLGAAALLLCARLGIERRRHAAAG